MKPADLAVAPKQENWLPLLEQSVQEVFQIMLNSKLEPVDQTQNDPDPDDFTSMVGLAGDLCGVLTLRCSSKSALRMTALMLGELSEKPDEQMWDALGEICNMIAGNFKNKLPGIGDRCMLSVPTVITGGDYDYHSLADAGRMDVRCSFEKELIVVALEIHS